MMFRSHPLQLFVFELFPLFCILLGYKIKMQQTETKIIVSDMAFSAQECIMNWTDFLARSNISDFIEQVLLF